MIASKKLSLLLFILAFLIQLPSARAVIFVDGHKIYSSPDESFCNLEDQLTKPLKEGELGPFGHSSKILLLAEGFNKIYDDLSVPLQKQIKPQAEIYKCDLDCKYNQRFGNIIYMRLDNTQLFPFLSNKFETIIMKRGMCYCYSGTATCGGLNFGSPVGFQFFSEVARVLNKNNPHSIAHLHGRHVGTYSKSESLQVAALEDIFTQLDAIYPMLDFRMTFRMVQNKPAYQKFYELYFSANSEAKRKELDEFQNSPSSYVFHEASIRVKSDVAK